MYKISTASDIDSKHIDISRFDVHLYAFQRRLLKPGPALGHRAEVLDSESDQALAGRAEQGEEWLIVLAFRLVVHLEIVQTCRGSSSRVLKLPERYSLKLTAKLFRDTIVAANSSRFSNRMHQV